MTTERAMPAVLAPMVAFVKVEQTIGASGEEIARTLAYAAGAVSGQIIGRRLAAGALIAAAHDLLLEEAVDLAQAEAVDAPRQ